MGPAFLRDEPLRTSAWEAMFSHWRSQGNLTLIQRTKTYKLQMSTYKTMSITQVYEDNIYLKCRDHDLDIKL